MYLGSDYLFQKDLAEAIAGKLSHGVLNLITGKCRNSMKKNATGNSAEQFPLSCCAVGAPEREFLVGEERSRLPQSSCLRTAWAVISYGCCSRACVCAWTTCLYCYLTPVGGTLKRTFLSFHSWMSLLCAADQCWNGPVCNVKQQLRAYWKETSS